MVRVTLLMAPYETLGQGIAHTMQTADKQGNKGAGATMELLMAPFDTLSKELLTWYNCCNMSCPQVPCSH